MRGGAVDLAAWTSAWMASPGLQAASALVGGLLLALLALVGFQVVVARVARATGTDLDDIVAEGLRLPFAASFLAAGTWWSVHQVGLPEAATFALSGAVIMATALLWGYALASTARRVLGWLSRNRERYHTVVTPRTLPVFDVAAKTVVFAGTVYFVFLAWDVDVTGWLASAGIVGIAVGFASQDTLGNLVAGVSILADAPYKLGDWLVLETGERGQVVDIGMRTTRLVTRDDVSIVVPNRLMANLRVTNQSDGPQEALRVAVPISFEYGCDLDEVHREVLGTVEAVPGVQAAPAPRLRFRAFGASGLDHEVLFWVCPPADRGLVVHRVLTAVYERCQEAGIQIPYATVKVLMDPVRPEESE